MTSITITPAFAASMKAIAETGKQVWVIINDDYAVGAYASRTEARRFIKEENLPGVIRKADEISFKVSKGYTESKPVEIARKSTIESPCFTVWDTADKMVGARRKDVIAACVELGVAYYTARTQYQLWASSKKNS